jgi:UDP-3-O-[3-hydroxymyristoyl] glucosamine N-acyltransferase
MIPLKEIASHINGSLIGDENIKIGSIASIKDAKEGEITFLSRPVYKKYLKDCKASAIIVGKDFPVDTLKNIHIIVVEQPAVAYIKTLELFVKPRKRRTGSSKLAVVSKQSRISKDVSIAPYVFIDNKAVIKSGVTIYPFVFIGENVIIDEGSTIYPHVTVYNNVSIGRNVTIHSGTVIGSDGFGYVWDGEKHAKIPHIGKVIIEDNVEIGANVTIDRAELGQTIIKKGTKIDNLVQIAHNVSIGENSIIVSQVGISGSATIGKNVVLAGQTGVADHVTVGDNVMAGGRTGITGDVPPNSLISGTPHMPHKEWLKQSIYLKKLTLLFGKIKKIEKTLHLEDNNG